MAPISHKVLQKVILDSLYVHLHNHKVVFLHSSISQKLAQTSSGWACGGVIVQSYIVVVQVHRIQDPFCGVSSLSCGRPLNARGNGLSQGLHIRKISGAFKAIYGVKFHGIVLHHPAEAAFKVLDAEVEVDPTLVHGGIRSIHKIGQEERDNL